MRKRLYIICCIKRCIFLSIALLGYIVTYGQTDYSTELGVADWSDYGTVSTAPPVNFFVGAWTHVYPPMGSGSKGNDYPFIIPCSESFYLYCVSGNMGYDAVAGSWLYNANTMTYGGDLVTVYLRQTEAIVRGWVYVGWHFKRNATTTTTTEFVKFGVNGTMEQVAQQSESGTYTPTSVDIGGGPGGWSRTNMMYAKLYAMSSIPTASLVNDIAMRTTPDPAAWGDWPLIEGSTKDVSGNGHDITINGKWSKGILGPALKSVTDLTNEINKEGIVSLSPNPAHEKVIVDITGEDYKTIDIIDITGRVMLSEEIKDNKIQMNTSTLSKGLYVVIVRGDNKSIKSKLLIE